MVKRLEPRVRYMDGWAVLQNAIKNQNYHSSKIKISIEETLNKCPDNLLPFIQWPSDWTIPEKIAKRINLQGSLDFLRYPIDTVPNLPLAQNHDHDSESESELDYNSNHRHQAPSMVDDEWFDYWEKSVGLSQRRDNKYNQLAIKDLQNRFNTEVLKTLIQMAAAAHMDKYAGKVGKIADFVQLKNLADDLQIWGKGKTLTKPQKKICLDLTKLKNLDITALIIELLFKLKFIKGF
jgi:hypothetical protein